MTIEIPRLAVLRRPLLAALALLAAFATPPAPAREDAPSPVLTLERAIEIAEAQNRQLGAADARLGTAEAGVDEARSFRLPRVDFDGGYLRTDNPVFVFGNLLRQENFGPENFDVDLLNRPDPLDNWTARVTVEQPLWTGGRIGRGEAAARHHRDAMAARRERTRQEVVRQATDAYATAVLAEHQLRVAREALETVGANVRLIRDLYEGGLVVESDLLLARVRESEVRETVIRAESGVEITRAALNLALGRDLETPFTLPEDLDPRDEGTADLDTLLERARARRPDLDAAREHHAAAESRTGVERSGRMPRVGLGATWETNAEDFLGDDDLLGGGDNWSLTVGVEVPLFDGFRTRARIARARRQASEAEHMAELLGQSIELEVRRAFAELRAARQRLEQSSKGAKLARRSLEIVEDRYKEGLTTLPEFLDAETALTAARLRQVAARRDVLLAGASLSLASGEL